MATEIRYPKGPVWPAEMRADMAAAYVDEPSVEAFLRKTGSVYPLATRCNGIALKWSREKLDRAIEERHGLEHDGEGVSELI